MQFQILFQFYLLRDIKYDNNFRFTVRKIRFSIINCIFLEDKINFFGKKTGKYKKFSIVEEGSQKKNMLNVMLGANF